MYRMSFILTLILILAVVAGAQAESLDERTLCSYINTGGGEVASWKGNLDGNVVCKVRFVSYPSVACLPLRIGGDYLTPLNQTWLSDNKVICRYKRK